MVNRTDISVVYTLLYIGLDLSLSVLMVNRTDISVVYTLLYIGLDLS